MKKSIPSASTILLLGNYRPTLSILRSVKRLGFKTIVTHSNDGAAGAIYSRFADEIWHNIHHDNAELFEQEITTLLNDRPEIVAIFPIEERYSILLAQIQNRLPSHLLIASPPPNVVRVCLDKVRMLDIASRLNVHRMPYANVRTIRQLRDAAHRLGFPIIVRPFTQYSRIGNKKAVICENEQQLAEFFPRWPADQPGLLIQKYVAGDRHDLYFIAENGHVKTFLETRITRTDRIDGTGLSTEGQYVPVSPKLAEDTRRLVAAVGYHGVGFSQFIVDDVTGQINFLELNPRVAGSHRCAEDVGFNLTEAAISLASNKKFSTADSFTYPAGGYYCWVTGDLHGLKEAAKNREITVTRAGRWIFGMMRSLLRCRIHLMWSWQDPKPVVMLLIRQTYRAITRPASTTTKNEVTATQTSFASLNDALLEPVSSNTWRQNATKDVARIQRNDL